MRCMPHCTGAKILPELTFSCLPSSLSLLLKLSVFAALTQCYFNECVGCVLLTGLLASQLQLLVKLKEVRSLAQNQRANAASSTHRFVPGFESKSRRASDPSADSRLNHPQCNAASRQVF